MTRERGRKNREIAGKDGGRGSRKEKGKSGNMIRLDIYFSAQVNIERSYILYIQLITGLGAGPKRDAGLWAGPNAVQVAAELASPRLLDVDYHFTHILGLLRKDQDRQ
jgi:hypothetical protein